MKDSTTMRLKTKQMWLRHTSRKIRHISHKLVVPTVNNNTHGIVQIRYTEMWLRPIFAEVVRVKSSQNRSVEWNSCSIVSYEAHNAKNLLLIL